MNMREEVTLTRNAEAVMIPSGEKVLVPEGARATITQSLGGSYTLITERGLMVRISGRETKAIGKPVENVPEAVSAQRTTPENLEAPVVPHLKPCIHPTTPPTLPHPPP